MKNDVLRIFLGSFLVIGNRTETGIIQPDLVKKHLSDGISAGGDGVKGNPFVRTKHKGAIFSVEAKIQATI